MTRSDEGLMELAERCENDIFVGKLVWITMCGSVDVELPDGRTIRTAPVHGPLYKRAREAGKSGLVEVRVPDKRPIHGWDGDVLSFPCAASLRSRHNGGNNG